MIAAADSVLVDRLRRHELIDADQAADLDALKGEGFSDNLVRRGILTKYQADHLLRDRLAQLELGAYRLLRPIGAGGMGEVYLAFQKKLRRNVAVKLIRPDFAAAHANALARFRREALAVARLAHPNIVHIYDADDLDGTHFIVMEYVPGIDLAKLVKERGPLPIDMACELVRQAALGLQHAHEAGLVHRDIKPSNLLAVLPEHERPGNFGLVKILDLGLARIEEEGGDLTMTRVQARDLLGTPDFISPEQAQDATDVDIRSDLYSLGCTFYYLLAGHPPFPTGTPIEKLMCHHLERPKSIVEIRPEVSAEVAGILGRLLRKSRTERHATPAELAAELAAVVGARPRKRPGKSSPAPAWPANPPDEIPSDLPPALLQSTKITSLDPVPELTVTPTKPAPTPERAAPPPAFSLESLRLPTEPPPAEPCRIVKAPTMLELATPMRAAPLAAARIAVLQGHTASVAGMAFGPGGRVLATGGLDQSLRVWCLDGDNTRQQTAFHDPRMGEVLAVGFLPNGSLLIAASGMGGQIWHWDWRSHEGGMSSLPNSPCTAVLAAAPDGRVVAAARGSKVQLWHAGKSGFEPDDSLVCRGQEVTALAFGNGGELLLAGDAAGRVLVWTLYRRRFRPCATFPAHSGAVTAITASTDGQRAATAGMDNVVRAWTNFDAVREVFSASPAFRGMPRRLALIASEPTLYALTDAGQAVRLDVDGDVEHDWRLCRVIGTSQALADDGRCVAVGQTDGSVAVYALRPDAPAYLGGSSLKPTRRR